MTAQSTSNTKVTSPEVAAIAASYIQTTEKDLEFVTKADLVQDIKKMAASLLAQAGEEIPAGREDLLAEANQLRRTGLMSESAFSLINKYDQALSLAHYWLEKLKHGVVPNE